MGAKMFLLLGVFQRWKELLNPRSFVSGNKTDTLVGSWGFSAFSFKTSLASAPFQCPLRGVCEASAMQDTVLSQDLAGSELPFLLESLERRWCSWARPP